MMFSKMTGIVLIANLFGLSACNTIQAQPSVNALLETPSAANREKLEQSIGDFFNSQPVKLADNVFTVSSTVLIERSGSLDNDTSLSHPRAMQPVDSFTLVLVDKHCLLRHDQTNTMLKLLGVSCIAE